MFIERSAGRIRLARTVFVVVGLVPCLLLGGWAVHRGSPGHRDAIRRSWQRVVGLPVEIAAVSHPRPGVIEAREVTVRSPEGRPLLTIATVEVEAAETEDRIRLAVADLDAESAAVLGGLAREWLRGDARHPRNCLIEVAAVGWSAQAAEPVPLRIECVGHDGTRAIRVVPAGGDEIRVVRTVDAEARPPVERFELDAHIATPLPAAVVAGIAGWGDAAMAVLAAARVTGDLHATFEPGDASGTATGRIVGLDLSECCRAVKAAGAGEATVVARRLAWRGGRLADAAIECECGPGWIDAPLFDRLVIALGCRPGAEAVAGGDRRSFDVAAWSLELDGGSVVVRPRDAAGIAMTGRSVLLHPPASAVAFERLACLVSPPGATFVPAAGPGAWLMSIVPGADGGGKTATKPAAGGDRRGF